MADLATLARPYARAAFEVAREQGALSGWQSFLERAAALVALAPVRDLITSPAAEGEARAALIGELAGGNLPAGGENLLRLMAANGRLGVLPDMAGEFARLVAEAETTIKVTFETAVPLDGTRAERLTDALGKYLGRKIEARFEVVPEIIGGVVMRVGDHVIDASLATRLRRLASVMAA